MNNLNMRIKYYFRIVHGYIKKLTNQPGIAGYISSLIYFTYWVGVKAGMQQAKNRQGFDLIHGVDTFELLTDEAIYSDNLISDDTKFAVHATSDKIERITEGIGYLTDEIIEANESTFLDFGCGKGRSLIVSHSLGFKSLIGIELSPYVYEVCRKNLEKMQIQCSLINESMKDLNYKKIEFPNKNIIVYAYNPTTVNILVESLNKLLSSWPDKNIFLIYTNPQSSIENNMIDGIKLLRKGHKIDVYNLS